MLDSGSREPVMPCSSSTLALAVALKMELEGMLDGRDSCIGYRNAEALRVASWAGNGVFDIADPERAERVYCGCPPQKKP